MTFAVCERNHALQGGRWVGTFETVEAAQEYIARKVPNTRAFVEFEVWRGTPKAPVERVTVGVRGAA